MCIFFSPFFAPKENGPFFAVMVCCAANAGANVTGNCLYKDMYECWWCPVGGTKPGATCTAGYAGCLNNSYISDIGDSPVTVQNGSQTTTYTCTAAGWEAKTSGGSSSSCDRYSYYQPGYGCKTCPLPDFTYEDGTDLMPRGDNYQFLLTGCNIYVSTGAVYKDDTGLFVYTDNATCYHSGKL